jgi:membrane protease YdiL (CAAX protease family)
VSLTPPTWARAYWHRSRSATYALLFALPLFVAYEALAAAMNAGAPLELRNAADLLVRRGLALAGVRTTLAVSALLVVAGALIVARERRRAPEPIVPRTFGLMLAESAVLALGFGSAVGAVTGVLLGPLAGWPDLPIAWQATSTPSAVAIGTGAQLVLSLGAGLYEELVFRVLLIPLLAAALTAVGVRRGPALAAAAILSALAFSAAHYVGPLGDAWTLGSFAFRFVGGLAFSAILVLRGFGIVAWTHALYDVFLIAAGG